MTNALGSWIQRISISSCNNRSANHLSAIARIPLTFRVAIFILVYKIRYKRGVIARDEAIHYSMMVSYKSFRFLLIDSINSILFCLFHHFNCFSLMIADSIVGHC